MKRDIKDYLHLYLGKACTIEWTHSHREDGVYTITWFTLQNIDSIKSVKIHLRPLSDMTDEEKSEVSTLVPSDESPYWVKNIAEVTKWYLDKGFDLFGLIEAGLAIDKTTLKQEA